jgi:hypothetical protein
VAATIIASSSSGARTWPATFGAASTTRWTPRSASQAARASPTPRGDDRLAGELLEPEPLERSERRDDHRRRLHGAAQHVLGQRLCQRVQPWSRRHPLAHPVRAVGVERERVERGEELGNAELQQRVGEIEVLRDLGERRGERASARATEEQHLRVVEAAGELGAGMAQRPLVQDLVEARAGRDRNALDQLREPRMSCRVVDFARRAAVVVQAAERDRVGLRLPPLQECLSLLEAAIGAEAPDPQHLAEEADRELGVFAPRAQADADDLDHAVSTLHAPVCRRGAGRA